MMLKEKLIAAFTRLGFDEYREILPKDIIFSQYVFDQCARNTCGMFGKNHGCPPKAGTEEERKNRVLKYNSAFVISKIISIRTRQEMNDSQMILARITKELRDEFARDEVLIMGAGPCLVCEKCTALTDEPCRFPEKTQYSMEGSGIDVVTMSKELNMTYQCRKWQSRILRLGALSSI
ncbi:DUF2284 domain-containing protein [Dehalobacter sp. DCM]|uniref:DUF2284 domain-containing protein n=1 Tax=Dehalobacter sp. DCM TaxID=2907827 RepID=UPI00308180C6|nr:DUF2284 domain-containing protein [Dehalobacter sp. DCM]